MISFPRTHDEAVAAAAELRAGGTDVQARRRTGVAHGALADLQKLPGLDQIEYTAEGGIRIGAMVRIATLAGEERIQRLYPGLAAAAAQLATPQIRAVATLGGNLLQRTRCWYYRHPAVSCYKKGGESCPARAGNHLYGVCFDLGACVAPHPSTLGMALLAYDAHLELHQRPPIGIADLFGDGSNPAVDNQLPPGALATSVVMPPPLVGEQAAYDRVGQRASPEWPLVEVLVRLVVEEQISFARVTAGGVANIPLRLHHVEQQLIGRSPVAEVYERAAAAAVEGAHPLPLTGYKVDLLRECVAQTLMALYRAPRPDSLLELASHR